MKAVTTTLYVCGGLMVAAAIMGSINYKAAKNNGSLEKLYKEEKTTPVVKQIKEIDVEDYSRGEINRIVEEMPIKEKKAPRKKEPNKQVVAATYTKATVQEELNEPVTKPVVNTRKKIRFSQFSRGPLPRKYAVDVQVNAITDSVESKAWDY